MECSCKLLCRGDIDVIWLTIPLVKCSRVKALLVSIGGNNWGVVLVPIEHSSWKLFWQKVSCIAGVWL